jgi:DNA-directed RNA polymerase subunit M/transcription elongation factor TFIIS
MQQSGCQVIYISDRSDFSHPPSFPNYNFRSADERSGDVLKHKEIRMPKIAKTADRKKVMDTSKSTDCPKCGKPTRIVKRVKDRERGVPGGIFISCSACEFYEKL